MLRKCFRELLIVAIETSLFLALVILIGILSVRDSELVRHVDSNRPKAPALPAEAQWSTEGVQPHVSKAILWRIGIPE